MNRASWPPPNLVARHRARTTAVGIVGRDLHHPEAKPRVNLMC
jgi:hypothetical protein